MKITDEMRTAVARALCESDPEHFHLKWKHQPDEVKVKFYDYADAAIAAIIPDLLRLTPQCLAEK